MSQGNTNADKSNLSEAGFSKFSTWSESTQILWCLSLTLNALLTTIGVGARDLAGTECKLNITRTFGEVENSFWVFWTAFSIYMFVSSFVTGFDVVYSCCKYFSCCCFENNDRNNASSKEILKNFLINISTTLSGGFYLAADNFYLVADRNGSVNGVKTATFRSFFAGTSILLTLVVFVIVEWFKDPLPSKKVGHDCECKVDNCCNHKKDKECNEVCCRCTLDCCAGTTMDNRACDKHQRSHARCYNTNNDNSRPDKGSPNPDNSGNGSPSVGNGNPNPNNPGNGSPSAGNGNPNPNNPGNGSPSAGNGNPNPNNPGNGSPSTDNFGNGSPSTVNPGNGNPSTDNPVDVDPTTGNDTPTPGRNNCLVVNNYSRANPEAPCRCKGHCCKKHREEVPLYKFLLSWSPWALVIATFDSLFISVVEEVSGEEGVRNGIKCDLLTEQNGAMVFYVAITGLYFIGVIGFGLIQTYRVNKWWSVKPQYFSSRSGECIMTSCVVINISILFLFIGGIFFAVDNNWPWICFAKQAEMSGVGSICSWIRARVALLALVFVALCFLLVLVMCLILLEEIHETNCNCKNLCGRNRRENNADGDIELQLRKNRAIIHK